MTKIQSNFFILIVKVDLMHLDEIFVWFLRGLFNSMSAQTTEGLIPNSLPLTTIMKYFFVSFSLFLKVLFLCKKKKRFCSRARSIGWKKFWTFFHPFQRIAEKTDILAQKVRDGFLSYKRKKMKDCNKSHWILSDGNFHRPLLTFQHLSF